MMYGNTSEPRFDVEQPTQFWRVQSSTPTNAGQWKYTVIAVEPRVGDDPEDLTWDDVAQTGFQNAINLLSIAYRLKMWVKQSSSLSAVKVYRDSCKVSSPTRSL